MGGEVCWPAFGMSMYTWHSLPTSCPNLLNHHSLKVVGSLEYCSRVSAVLLEIPSQVPSRVLRSPLGVGRSQGQKSRRKWRKNIDKLNGNHLEQFCCTIQEFFLSALSQKGKKEKTIESLPPSPRKILFPMESVCHSSFFK